MKAKSSRYDADFMQFAELPPFDEFITRVTEMDAHNIINYGDENPTLDGAFHEILIDMVDEIYLNHVENQKEQAT